MRSSGTVSRRGDASNDAPRPPARAAASPGVVSAKPPLKWAGGKRWQVKHLLPLWRRHAWPRLVEPFCGGLAVALGLAPRRALLNDINPHLVGFYRWLKKGLTIDVAMENNESLYYLRRRRFNEILEADRDGSREAAQLFYYLNRTGYNGLCRFNRRGQFNVPFGRYERISYRHDFSVYRHLFADWQFATMDFEKIALRKDDFVYADPPYDVEFTHYAKEGFSWDDQVRLVDWLAGHKGPVVLSNQATERIVRLYETAGYRLLQLRAPRRISCTGDRTPAREVLALRNV
jgi:DNA adenine methylase